MSLFYTRRCFATNYLFMQERDSAFYNHKEVLLMVLFFAAIFQPGWCFGQSATPDTSIKPYLIDVKDTIPFVRMGQDISGYNYYFSSENHRSQICLTIEFDMVK